MKDMEQKMVREFQEYTEPGEDFPASPQRRNTSLQEDKDDSVILPLGADTLTCNLGIPVVVVCTKCDAISLLEKEHDYRDEHFDFIQSHIRRFCLQYGAALIYTSVKENKNIDLVYKYIVQKLYGFPFNIPAVVVEKDAVFIPAGWDNEKKIGILHENFQTLKVGDSFEDIVTKPPVRKFVHEKEIMAEDDQVFLTKQQSLLAKQPPTAAGRPVDASPRVPGGSPRTPNRSVTSNVASVTPIPAGAKKIDPSMKAGATSEGVLANFFNSLLSKKTGSPGGPPGVGSPGGGGGTGTGGSTNLSPSVKKPGQKPVLTDVQAELDRMSRKPDLASPTTPTSPTEEKGSFVEIPGKESIVELSLKISFSIPSFELCTRFVSNRSELKIPVGYKGRNILPGRAAAPPPPPASPSSFAAMENGGQVYGQTTEAAPSKGPFWASCTTGHLGLRRFSLKVAQLVLSFLAFVLEEVVSQCTRCFGLYFFEFVSCSAFLLCIPILFICCTSFYEKIGKEKLNKLDMWILISVVTLFFLASIVFSATSDKTPVETAALVFGYFASIAFLVDAILLIRKLRKTKEEKQPENAANTLNGIENQPLNNQPA
ncbi:hypothetical protein JRQ81_018803 [Phrynocephalus forsythii]|uniref:Dynein light intermediate chain n=1 Tax=Phrynocephalus forsythii TaxID=171643 RepID=A0A9Q0XSK5_9SAUR|nr:hypothetical protein JRQ81_018803 [Phrynocephalus forsythii]